MKNIVLTRSNSSPAPLITHRSGHIKHGPAYFSILVAIAALLLPAPAISGMMYKCTRPDGRVEYTDQPCVRIPHVAGLASSSEASTIIEGDINLISSVSTLAGSAHEEGSADGVSQSARFTNPTGITSDGTSLYITESGGGTIRKYELATGRVSTLAGQAGQRGYKDGFGPNARFNSPHGITNDGTNLYVADSMNKLIRKVSIATGEVTTLAGQPIGGFTDGVGTEARFSFPEDVTVVGTNLYVTDMYGGTVRKIDLKTARVSTFAGQTVYEDKSGVRNFLPGFIDGKGPSARFNFPMGITNDGKNLFVADQNNNKIRKIDIATSEVTTLAGPGEAECIASGWHGRCPGGNINGTGPSVRFSSPQYLTTDGTYLYVTTSNNTIRSINISSGNVSTIMSGEARSTASPNIARQLSKAWGILITKDHDLVITDRVGHTVLKLK